MSALGKPRPIEAQTWRRHHRPRWAYAPAEVSPASGCSRRRRKAIARRQWIADLAERWSR